MRVLHVFALLPLVGLVTQIPALATTPRLSGDAEQDLDFPASVLSGHAVLRSGRKPDGSIYRHILSAECPIPGETESARLARVRALSDTRKAEWRAYFAKLADVDRSGVVTPEEARALKRAVYYGITAAQLADIKTFEELDALMDDDDGVLAAALELYPIIQEATERDGVKGLPRLPPQFLRPARTID
jgi:hypothetical protein